MMTAKYPEEQVENLAAIEAEAWANSSGPGDRDRGRLAAPQLRVVSTRAELHDALTDATMYAPGLGRRAVVMTMGALHNGHLELVRAARAACDHLTVTIFVNPLQFGQGEDLDKYPRDLDADLKLLEDEGVDLVFAPSVETMFPKGKPEVTVRAGRLGTVLEGAARPGHFDGVATIVAKLLHLTRPEIAFFGQKDAQQLAVIRRMVRDLEFSTDIRTVPIIRDEAGLALSSRNSYLTPGQYDQALSLSAALRAAGEASGNGTVAVREAASAVLATQPVAVDYQVLVDPDTLEEVSDRYEGPALMLLAVRVGEVRLLDNMELDISSSTALSSLSERDLAAGSSAYDLEAQAARSEISRPDISQLAVAAEGAQLAAAIAALEAHGKRVAEDMKETVAAEGAQLAEGGQLAWPAENAENAETAETAEKVGPAETAQSTDDAAAFEDSAEPEKVFPGDLADTDVIMSVRAPVRLASVDPTWVAPTRIAPANLVANLMANPDSSPDSSLDSSPDSSIGSSLVPSPEVSFDAKIAVTSSAAFDFTSAGSELGAARSSHDLPPPTRPVEVP